jgi:hypothetical protein
VGVEGLALKGWHTKQGKGRRGKEKGVNESGSQPTEFDIKFQLVQLNNWLISVIPVNFKL